VGFNWATSFQTWKYLLMLSDLAGLLTFQLGHVFSDMEIRRVKYFVYNSEAKVSIGPRPFRHGNAIVAIASSLEKKSFNWATSFQTWKYNRIWDWV